MKKSKITLLYKLFPLFLIPLLFNLSQTSIYNKNTKQVIGTIYSCKYKDDKTIIEIKNKEKLLINYYGKFNCKLGTKIKVNGEIKKPNENTNFYLFNYKKYLLSKKIYYTFSATKIKIINNNPNIFYQIKNTLINHVKKYKSKDYLNALILGNTDDIEQNIKESYQTNGISHLLAISGAQITLLSSILIYLLNKVFNKNISLIITSIFLIFYLFITDFQPSILRATIFFILLTINKLFELKIKTIDLLILTFLILLSFNPYYIYSLGFELSFVVSFYLLLFKNLINKHKDYISKSLTISLIAFLSSSPILINSFFTLNLISPIINIYFGIIMTIIYPISLVTFIFKPLDNVLYMITSVMENASLKISNITLFNLSFHHLNIYFFLFYYIIITIILYLWSKNKNYLYVFFLILIIHHNINYLNPYSTLTMIDVGQGDGMLIKLKHNQGNILIDTGGQVRFDNKESYDIAANITIPYLKAEGINKLDYLIITHGDYDHAGMAINLIKNFKINNIILNKENNNLENKITKTFQGKITNTSLGKIKINNETLNFINGFNSHDENNDSLIIYTKIDKENILLMGDASSETEKYLLNTYNLNKMDILKVGHHGSKYSSSEKFIKKINPKVSLISAGKNNMYNHPHKETLNRLRNSKVFITKKDGAIKINLTLGTIKCVR